MDINCEMVFTGGGGGVAMGLSVKYEMWPPIGGIVC